MKKRTFLFLLLFTLCFQIITPGTNAMDSGKDQTLRVSLQLRLPSDLDEGAFIITNEIQEWNAAETAIIICDMWDRHWCKGATERVAEMAPFINTVAAVAREKGALIVHAPSDCMDFYVDHPARKLGGKYHQKGMEEILGSGPLDSEVQTDWPFEISGGGCDDAPQCAQAQPWSRQIETIEISDEDAISDSGLEVGSLLLKKGIRNVIFVGVHTNMCVMERSFGIRNMTRLGMNVALMRDLTDVMYDAASPPYVSHYTGNSLMHEYIEKYACPTMLSCDFSGDKQFRFKNDTRPLVAFISAESEYRSDQRLPEFAHQLLLEKDVNCEFALGLPLMNGEGRHNIENLQILSDADLAVFFIRRRALEPEKMDQIKNYVYSGRPVLGIRTASHAFDTKGNVPREGGNVVTASGSVSEYLSSWPEFDEEILGGNYQGHYGHLEEGTRVSVVPGMESHALLKGVDPADFVSPNWLYKNRPLRSENIQVLMTGSIPGEAAEPVFWLNKNKYGPAVYTSLGHWDDWEIESFYSTMLNSIDYLLKPENE